MFVFRYLFLFFLSFASLVPATSFAFTTLAPNAVLVDLQSGQILFAKDSTERVYPASMTKVLTAYLVMEDILNEKISFQDMFTVSEKAWKAEGSRMFLEPDTKVSVVSLLRGLIVQSGNDAAIALAEGVSGTEEAFAQRMTITAHNLGATSSNFTNASGLPDVNHYSTTEDLALIGAKAISDHLNYYPLYAEASFRYNGIEQFNRNKLLQKVNGVDGLKTGHTEKSGYGIMVSATRKDRRLLLVVNGLNSEDERAREAQRLIEWGYGSWDNFVFHKAGDVLTSVPAIYSDKDNLNLTLDKDLIVSTPFGAEDKLEFTVSYQGPVLPGVRVGDELGSLIIKLGETNIVKPVIAVEDLNQAGFFRTFMTNLKRMF